MAFISYAQNYEDVILWRALRDVEQGFYVDVGAADPDEYSVTHAFYERGWSGINVEPLDEYFDRLVQARPNDKNLKVAVGREAGVRAFYTFPSGWSTLNPRICAVHEAAGLLAKKIVIPVLTLTKILEDCARSTIHFLKIDVEGSEHEVLEGLRLDQVRPWIIVVEATEPNSSKSTRDEWERMLTCQGYGFAYFDGLNCFYVADEVCGLRERLAVPPNVFDDFVGFSEWAIRQEAAKLEQEMVNLRGHSRDSEEALQAQTADLRVALQAEQVQTADLRIALKAEQVQAADLRITLKAEQAQAADLRIALKAEQVRAADLLIASKAEQAQAADLLIALKAEQAQAADLLVALKAEQARTADLLMSQQAEQAQIAKLHSALQSEQVRTSLLAGRIHQLEAELAAPSLDRAIGRALRALRSTGDRLTGGGIRALVKRVLSAPIRRPLTELKHQAPRQMLDGAAPPAPLGTAAKVEGPVSESPPGVAAEKVELPLYSVELSAASVQTVKIIGPDGHEQGLDLHPGQTRCVEIQLCEGRVWNTIRFETNAAGKKSEREDREVFFNINLRTSLTKFAPPRDTLEMVNGFSVVEDDGQVSHVWAIARQAEIRVVNIPGEIGSALYSFDLFTVDARSIKITQPDGQEQTLILRPNQSLRAEVPLFGGTGNIIRFETDTPGVQVEGGNRTLFFDLNLRTGTITVPVPRDKLKLFAGFTEVEGGKENPLAWATARKAELHVPDILFICRTAALPASARSTYLQLRTSLAENVEWNRTQ